MSSAHIRQMSLVPLVDSLTKSQSASVSVLIVCICSVERGVGSYIDFEDLIVANCCIEDGIRLDLSLEGNVITITETELSEGSCYCICNYPTTARLGPFDPGTYTVQVYQVDYFGYVVSIGEIEVIIHAGI